MSLKHFKYSEQYDLDLMDQVCVVNPWGAGKTWEDVKEAAKAAHPDFTSLTAKGLYDRAKHLMTERKAKLASELKASGIEVDELSQLDRAIDEAILLKEEAERIADEKETVKKADNLGQVIRDTALINLKSAPKNEQGQAEATFSTDTPIRRKRTSYQMDMVISIIKKKMKLEEEKAKKLRENAEEERIFRREELEFRRKEAEEGRQLKREELALREKELNLQAKREEEASRERQLLVKLLAEMKN